MEFWQKKIKELNHIESTSRASENKAFFNYSDIEKRYETVKKHTTEKGLIMHSLLVQIKSQKDGVYSEDYSVISDFDKTMS